MSAARVLAQAKVNLTLRILARETGGFHQIETLFQRLDVGDVVTVRPASGRALDVRFADATRAADLGPAEQNLAWRAADAYATVTGWPGGFAIEIEKSIPVGGGLGGGSADAAAVLRGLDALAPRALGTDALIDIAARLGADVAFLASPSELALAWGRGDRLLDLPPLPAASVLLVIPDFGVNTGQAYAAVAAARGTSTGTSTGAGASAVWRAPNAFGSWSTLAADAVNDFEPVVFEMHPSLGTVRAQLAALPATLFARMSGSGSTLFAVQDQSATTGLLALPSGWRFIASRTAAQQAVELT